MSTTREGEAPLPRDFGQGSTRLWAAAAVVAGLGSLILYDAHPGINAVLWTATAVAGLHLFARQQGTEARPRMLLGGMAIVIAGGIAITANPAMHALAIASVALLLALQMLLTARPLPVLTPRFVVLAPFAAVRADLTRLLGICVDTTQQIRSPRMRAWVRGLVLTLPVLGLFALLLAEADPVFARWRDGLEALLSTWDLAPRILHFLILLAVVLGAYAYAASSPVGVRPVAGEPRRWLGSIERSLLLGGVAALLWLFLIVQVGYLFLDHPQTLGSGMSFAEYARRGFGELSFVASASGLLIVASERYGARDSRERLLRILTLVLIAAVILLLGSAFRRVWLYEAAYGFTTARLQAQIYMVGVAIALALLTREVLGGFDAIRLFQRAAVAAVILFIGLLYWNDEAWIAERNLDRFASTGKLDIAYLSDSLSPDAVPAIMERLPSLPEPTRTELLTAIRVRYDSRSGQRERAWYEWNRAHHQARRALGPG